MVEKIQKAGIIPFGIGVDHKDIVEFYGKNSICVNNLDTMAESIFRVVRKALLDGLGKAA